MSKTKALFGRPGGWLTSLFLVSSACSGSISDPTPGATSTPGPGSTPGSTAGAGSTPGSTPGTGSTPGAGSTPGTGSTPGAGGAGSTPGSTAGAGTTPGAAGAGTTPAAPGASLWDPPATTVLDSGRLVLRRLNNPEYDNTVRDLMGTMSKATATYTFPSDGVDELFDTSAQALAYSQALFTQVYASAQGLVAEFLARPAADPVRTRLLTCTPTMATLSSCLTTVLTSFMAKAYRRPVTPTEVSGVVTVATTIATAHNDPMTGVSAALEAVLLSPHFLFRVESSQDITSSAPTKLNDYELATRLSYFIGSTMPDAALTMAAASSQLASGGAGYTAQVDRLLADPVRLQAFVDTFTYRLLGIVDAPMVAPDEMAFPTGYDDNLRLSAPQETTAFFASLVRDNQPIPTLLTANFSFVNDRLAKHYGIPSPGGTAFAKVTLSPESHRMGLLTQETFLTTTSLPARTSPVKRGVWVLENLLCDGTPAPPPGVPALPDEGTGTVRQVLEKHRAQAYCASCHKVIDPIGLALENFDAIGAYRTQDNGINVDASAIMPDTTALNGAVELSNYIAKDPRFTWCFAKQVMTYAVGRTFEPADGRAYVKGVAGALGANPTWASLIKAVASSEAFTTNRGKTP